MRKLFKKYLNFQIDGFLFIAIYMLTENFHKCSILAWGGLEIFVKILLMKQRCVGSTFKLFLSKQHRYKKLPMHNIEQMNFWSSRKSLVIRTRVGVFFKSCPCFDVTSYVIVSHFSQSDCTLSVWNLFCNSHTQNPW